jgi:hypothetical protein
MIHDYRGEESWKGLKSKMTNQLVVYTDGVKIMVQNINIIKKTQKFQYTLVRKEKAVPRLRRLVSDPSSWRPGFALGLTVWDFWWTKWHWDRYFA